MKKFLLIILCIFGISFFSNYQANAISVADFTPALDKKVANMRTTQEKVNFLQSFADTLATPTFTKDKNAGVYKNLREYVLNMLNVFQHELQQEQPKSTNKSSTKTTYTTTTTKKTTTAAKSTVRLPHISDNFSNINEQEVRNAILSWHNDERYNVGVNPYTYNLDLEGSATIWANKLASTSKIQNLHLRNNGDGTYSYTSILNRFSDLGIKFPASVKGAASFSESIGYGYYKCSKSDCTQDLINAVKKTRTGLIMKEKSTNGSHYRAAVMKHFTQMGAGIAIDKSNNRYYIILHYGVNF